MPERTIFLASHFTPWRTVIIFPDSNIYICDVGWSCAFAALVRWRLTLLRKPREGDERKRRKNGWNARNARGRGRTQWEISAKWSSSFRRRSKSDGLFNLATHCHSFRDALLCLLGRSGPRRPLSPLDFILPQLSPFRIRDGDGGANGADRNSGGLSEEKQSREDFSVSSPETERVVRKMIYLCFLSSLD